MEAAAGRGGALPPPSSSQAGKREWRAVAEHSFRGNGSEGQSDERTIYEVRPLDVDFIVGVGELSDDLLQQRLQEITRQREGLQQMEIELRAQAIAKSEILEIQNNFEAQLKEHATTNSKLKEQLQQRETHVLELEKRLEEKERELRALKIDNEAAWAKEDLLIEQTKELATFRRERDNAEAERIQHLKKIRDLQEHIQEKESQFITLEEQQRVTQETIIFKDEQLREAQAWIARVQEMDALQSSTNQSLQAELRERTEQFNQYYMGLQRQFAEIERHHMQVIQQLHLELAEAKERSGIYKDGSQGSSENSVESSSYIQTSGGQINPNEGGKTNGNSGFTSNGSFNGTSSYISASNQTAKSEQVADVPMVQSAVLGMGAFLPPGQMTTLHPYVMNPQGVAPSVAFTNLPIPQSHMSRLQPISTLSSHQHWQTPQAASDVSQVPTQTKYQTSQTEQDLSSTDARSAYALPGENQIAHHQINTHGSQQLRCGPATNSLMEVQVLESNEKQHSLSLEPQGTLNVSSQFKSTLESEAPEEKNETKDEDILAARNQSHEQFLDSGLQCPTPTVVVTVAQDLSVSANGAADCNEKANKFPEVPVSATRGSSSLALGKPVELTLLDERSLLACIVRAIPAASNGGIRISTTLPNRLAKMLAPLHWHDYKKRYGKLDEFVSHHPELFVIEGDFIHLREGAQEIISATTAVAKVAAAVAASPAPYSSPLPSIAVNPAAQVNGQRRSQAMESKSAKSTSLADGSSSTVSGESIDKGARISKIQDQLLNGANFNIIKELSDVTISSKSKNDQETNGLVSEIMPTYSSAPLAGGITINIDKAGLPLAQSKGLSNGRYTFGGKQQGRASRAGLISRR